jgi:glycosyltransferase involved in cell wall biosynthesis
MKFSIVTISFNQHAYLPQAIESVLTQNYAELEYIVVDPGSEDGSRDIIHRYRNRINRILLQPDKGPADGLNNGFAVATGQILGFLNADDLLLPGALVSVSDFFSIHPNVDIVFGNGFIIDSEGRRQRHIQANSFSLMQSLYGGACWLQQSTFFRREIFEKAGGFNVENRSCWDAELFTEMLKKGARVGYVRQDLACFRIHKASISGSLRSQQIYHADRARIFKAARGRDWQMHDGMICAWYRLQRLLSNPLAVGHSLKTRLARFYR